MARSTETALRRWLDAEREGRDTTAERELEALFAALPEASPAADFSDRVLAALPLGRLGETRVGSVPWWSRGALAASVLTAGLTAALMLPLVFALARLVAPADAIGGAVQGLVAVASKLDELLSLWQVWAHIVDTALLVATAPPVVLVLLTLTVLSALTFRGLKKALVPHRSSNHVAAF